jgi:hypothetical protein
MYISPNILPPRKKKKNRDTKILEKELCSHVQTEEE